MSSKNQPTPPDKRQAVLSQRRNLKMAESAHAYVRGSTVKFYEWLEQSNGKVPDGPPVWICGDCHVGNLGPVANAKGRIGLNTTTPKTLLDVNGVMKLKLNTKEPVPCGPDYQGALAMTREARMCACNSANAWVDLNSEAVCIW